MSFSVSRCLTTSLKRTILPALIILITLPSCKHKKKVYTSDCNNELAYIHVTFTQLIDSIQNYDHQFIEVQGTYREGDAQSALVNDSLFTDHSNGHALWVNFSQDCPLYLKGTRQGLFEYNDGKFTQISNKSVIIRGKIDMRHKGHLGSYRGEIDRVSYIEM
ncbi:MAG TPA: hypothetical protein VFE53_24280 [Mucilaginibacter sp.]|nr:hypothetical protein [Mucilaginibacter sp.]